MKRRIALLFLLTLSAASGAAEQKWIEVTTPSFRVISNASESRSKRAAIAFEQMRAVMKGGTGLRLDRGEDFVVFAVEDEDAMKQLLPAMWKVRGMMRPAGVFMNGLDRDFAVVRLDAPEDYMLHVVYHEYVHKIVNANYRHVPTWLNEGLAEFYGNSQLSGNRATVGRPSQEVYYLRDAVMLPLDVLLNSNQMSDQYRKEDKAHRFYAESWALTHFLIFGPGMENGKKMGLFLRELQTEKDQIAVFERTFGKLPDIQKGLEAYVRRMLMPAIIVENPARLANDQIKVRQFTTWEKDAELAALFDRSGGREGREKAEEMFKASIEHQPTAAAEEGLGLSQLYAGHAQEAVPHFKAAMGLDPERYLSAYYYAVNDKELATAQKRELLTQVVKRKPNFSRALFALSRLAADEEQDLDTAKKYAMLAIEADPNQAAYYTQVALIYERKGDTDNAIRVAERVVNNFEGPERYAAQKLLDRLRKNPEKPAENAAQ